MAYEDEVEERPPTKTLQAMSDVADGAGWRPSAWATFKRSFERVLPAHSGRVGDISIYGQESNYTWRLAKMNLAIRGIDAQIAHGDTFHNSPETRAGR